MTDGLRLTVRPTTTQADLLQQHGAVWSINDVDGGRQTRAHGRGRMLKTPLTQAGGKVTCWPEGSPSEQRKGIGKLSYELSFYPPASLMGNNLFPQNLVRVPAEGALIWWKAYMRTRYGTSGVVEKVLEEINSSHCAVNSFDAVYLWEFASAKEAMTFHERLYTHCKAYLDKDSRRCVEDALGRMRPQGIPRVRTDAGEGDTFYVDLPFGFMRAYIKVPGSEKAFSQFQSEDIEAKMFERATRVVRLEVNVDVRKFRIGAGESFPLSPAHWTRESMPRDPFEIIWEKTRSELALDGSLAKHNPTKYMEKLPQDYRQLGATHLQGGDLVAACPDAKKRSRILKRLRRDARLSGTLPWEIQRSETWSSWLEARTRYEYRLRPERDAVVGAYSLTENNVIQLKDAMAASCR